MACHATNQAAHGADVTPKLVLFGDGSDAVGDALLHPTLCTPALDWRRQGAVHVLLRRALREIRNVGELVWVHPIAISTQMGGPAADYRSWAQRLRGTPRSSKLHGRPYLAEYLRTAGHGVDVAVFVHDTEKVKPRKSSWTRELIEELVADIRAEVKSAAGTPRGVSHVEVGVMVPCLEAWLLTRRLEPGACDPLKEELHQRGVRDRREKVNHAKTLDVRALYDAVPEFRDLVDRIARHLGEKEKGEPG